MKKLYLKFGVPIIVFLYLALIILPATSNHILKILFLKDISFVEYLNEQSKSKLPILFIPNHYCGHCLENAVTYFKKFSTVYVISSVDEKNPSAFNALYMELKPYNNHTLTFIKTNSFYKIFLPQKVEYILFNKDNKKIMNKTYISTDKKLNNKNMKTFLQNLETATS